MRQSRIITSSILVGIVGFVSQTTGGELSMSLSELEGDYAWTRVYYEADPYDEFGGPKTTTVHVPELPGTITAITVAVVGTWEETCGYDEHAGETDCWLQWYNVTGGCVDLRNFAPSEPGLAWVQQTFTDCDFGALEDSEVTFTGWTEPLIITPVSSANPDTTVTIHSVQVTYEVDDNIDVDEINWSAVKSRWRER